jgi:hypothetical protein
MPKTTGKHSTPRRGSSKTKLKVSAVSRVIKSGFDLVPTRKSTGKRASISDYANMDFKPWKREPGMRKNELFPSLELIDRHAVACRAAYASMLMSRDEMIASVRRTDQEQLDTIMAIFAEASEFLKTNAFMVESAYMRMLASAAAAMSTKSRLRSTSAA